MSFYELFKKGHQSRNIAHFASIVNIAAADGTVTIEEEELLQELAAKLGIGNSEYTEILKNPSKYPIQPSNSAEERLERIHDLFDMVFADHSIGSREFILIKKYAIGLGYDSVNANELIQKSIDIYSGSISFEEYKFMIKNRLKL